MLSQRQIDKAIVGLIDIFTPQLFINIIIIICIYLVIKKWKPEWYIKYKNVLQLLIYGVILLQVMWLNRAPSDNLPLIEWIPFVKIYEKGILHETRVIGAILNILLYIPYGVLYRRLGNEISKYIGCIFFTSLLIELGQYYCRVGTFKVENLITNTLGGVMGILFYQWWNKRRSND